MGWEREEGQPSLLSWQHRQPNWAINTTVCEAFPRPKPQTGSGLAEPRGWGSPLKSLLPSWPGTARRPRATCQEREWGAPFRDHSCPWHR